MAAAVFAVRGAGLFLEVGVGMAAFGIFAVLLKLPTSGELSMLNGLAARGLARLGLRTRPA
jgi:hypothetical protein